MASTAISATDRWVRNLRDHVVLPYEPFPKQREFHASPAKYRLFGGAAGPGKSMALLMESVIQANETAGADTLLLRRTFPELETSLLAHFRRNVPRELYCSFNDAKHVVTWWNGSTTRFGYCQNENDVYQYQGAEFLFVGIDELTLFTLKQWQFLTSRNRCPVPGAFPNMAGATNPGNIGHAWVKALWVDRRAASGMESAAEYDPADYAFIAARIWDNPIYAHDENYLKKLRALPEKWRRAFLDGDWDVFAGQYFDIFDFARHTAPLAELGIQPWWPRWISVDWGFEHPAAVYWHASAPDGSVVTYREFVQNRLSPRMLAEAIAEQTAGERVTGVYLSPDAFAKRTAKATIAEQLGEGLARAGLPQPEPADNDRIGGWMLLYQLLESDRWVIANSCARLIECLPVLTRDEANVEDVLKVDGDDAADAARYGLKSRLAPGRAPIEQRVAERITAVDPTSRAIQIQKALLEEQRKSQPVRFAGSRLPRQGRGPWRPQW